MSVNFLLPGNYPRVPVTKDYALRVAVSIAGSSGTGKTYSGCLLARGLSDGKPFAFIDTENKRALHYRADFPEMQHYNFGPDAAGDLIGFPPERWIALLDQIEKTDVGAIVIDSFSHAWEGINGVLELQAQAVERLSGGDNAKAARVGQLAWAEIKPRYRRLVERIVQAKVHVVICIRAKPVMQEGFGNNRRNARETKLRRKDLPWDIASDRDLVFEMTASMLMEPERPGQPVLLKCPDHFLGLFPKQARVTSEIGMRMRSWAQGDGQGENQKALLDAARLAARKGKDGLQAHWKTLNHEERAIVQTVMQELKDTAIEAGESSGDDLFGDNSRPTPEQMAEAERAARAAIAQEGDDQ